MNLRPNQRKCSAIMVTVIEGGIPHLEVLGEVSPCLNKVSNPVRGEFGAHPRSGIGHTAALVD